MPRDADRDLDEELAAHLALLIDEKVAAGMAPAAARRAALLEMGGTTQVAEAVRDVRRGAWLREFTHDARYLLRALRREVAFTVTVILTLVIGISANVAIFSLVDTLLLRKLPVRDPDHLVLIGKPTAIDGHSTGTPRGDLLSLPLYRDLRNTNHLVTGLAATGTAVRIDVGRGAEMEHPVSRFVSANFFDVLGVSPGHGRFLDAADDVPGASPVAVISDAYARRHFGANTNGVGQQLLVDGVRLTIVGVAPPAFTGAVVERATDVWMPIALQPILQPGGARIDRRTTNWLLLFGRLAPHTTLEQARAGFATLIHQLLAANAATPGEAVRLRVAPIAVGPGAHGISAARQTYAAPLETLSIGVFLLLLIVCANVANLLLARGVARAQEMATRLALGASRSRLVRQLVTESVVLALLGCIPGLLLGSWASQTLLATASAGAGVAPRLDLPVLAFALGLVTLAVMLFGLVPALRITREHVAVALRSRGSASLLARGSRHGAIPIGRLLIPAQVTLSLVLLAGSALLSRNLWRLETTDPGIDRDHLLVVQLDVARRGLAGERLLNFVDDLTRRLESLPGVRDVSYSQNGLFAGHNASALVSVPGFTGRTAEDSILPYDLVGPGYLHAIGARLLRGRDIDVYDGVRAPSVAVVTRAAERYYFGGDAIGKPLYFDAGVPTTVVGVIDDIKDQSLVRREQRRAYAPYAQQLADLDEPELYLELRTLVDPAAVAAAVRNVIAATDPELIIAEMAPLSTLMGNSIRQQRLLTFVALAFGCVSLALAIIGLYGAMSYAVGTRRREMGLRGALGAEPIRLVRLVLADGLRLVVIGLLLGAPLALVAARLLRAQLTDVPPTDPLSLIGASMILICSAAVAALIPARRAAHVSPLVALRGD